MSAHDVIEQARKKLYEEADLIEKYFDKGSKADRDDTCQVDDDDCSIIPPSLRKRGGTLVPIEQGNLTSALVNYYYETLPPAVTHCLQELASDPSNLLMVLSGQTRSFTDTVTRNSIRQNAIDALCPSPAECAAVLFLCAELGECRAVAAATRRRLSCAPRRK